MLLVLIGTTAGLGSGIAAAQLLKRVLFRVDPSEPGTFALVILVWVVVALLACYFLREGRQKSIPWWSHVMKLIDAANAS